MSDDSRMPAGAWFSFRPAGVAWALRLAAVVVLAGCATTQYLSRLSPRTTLVQGAIVDPLTTGSIGEAARGVVLDPCTAPSLRR